MIADNPIVVHNTAILILIWGFGWPRVQSFCDCVVIWLGKRLLCIFVAYLAIFMHFWLIFLHKVELFLKTIIYLLGLSIFFCSGCFLWHLRITICVPLWVFPTLWFYFSLTHISLNSAHFFVTFISFILEGAEEHSLWFRCGYF